ncbi:MAG: hypothetical protein JWP04_2892 [Belnapia sp.]|nr:hypothetical protein [Belnapia sp.]
MMRTLQFTAIRAFRVGHAGQGLMAATHAGTGGRNFFLRDGHGAEPFLQHTRRFNGSAGL